MKLLFILLLAPLIGMGQKDTGKVLNGSLYFGDSITMGSGLSIGTYGGTLTTGYTLTSKPVYDTAKVILLVCGGKPVSAAKKQKAIFTQLFER